MKERIPKGKPMSTHRYLYLVVAMAILLSVTLLPTDGQASASCPLPPSVIESVEEGVDITPMDTKTLDALNAALLKNNKDIAPNGAIWCE